MSGNNIQRQGEQAQHTIVEIASEFDQVPGERKILYLELYRAALNGDWKTAQGIFEKFPKYKSANISQRKETALHIAAAANRTHFAIQLVNMMKENELAQKNVNGNTAFFLVAASGNVKLAMAMMEKNPKLATIRGNKNVSPLYMAAVYGRRKMVLHLYDSTKEELIKEDPFEVLIALLKCNIYEYALQVLVDHPYLTAKVANEEKALEVQKALELHPYLTEVANEEKALELQEAYLTAKVANKEKASELRKALELHPYLTEVANEEKALELQEAYLSANVANEEKASELLKALELRKALELQEKKALQLQKALELLAQRPRMYSCFDEENEQGIWKRCIKIFSGNNVVQNKTSVKEAAKLVERLLGQVMMSDSVLILEKIGQLIFVAAKQGNVEFLTMFIRLYPELIWKCDNNKQSIFHIAVLHRHEDIFKLIHEIGSIKDLIATYIDKKNGNNMLHMAGLLPPTNRLNIVPGAALQMQRELLWFKEVKKIMQPLKAAKENKEHETPGALFTRNHSDLMKEGEKWMRDTANSCMLVATLIATVVFAAAFTVPGGNRDQTGIPLFLKITSFQIFAVSDAISLLFSCTSILVFLSILTARYTEEDFLWLLPTKLIIGLVTLLISVAAMMVAFTATFFIVFHQGLPHFAIVVAAIACVPVILFVVLHWPLFRDIIRSTYMSWKIFKKNKRHLFSKKD